MKSTCRPLGNACISTGNGYAFDASAAGAAGAAAATSAARSESSMRILRGPRMVADTRRESRNQMLHFNRGARRARRDGNELSRSLFWLGLVQTPAAEQL